MADGKTYYYMRLKDNFFDTNEMVVLESLQDGYLYSNILLKLYLRSLRDNGRLMFNNAIPYNPQMIATITRHQIGTVERALKIFQEMGLIEILDSGAIYMLNIQNYIGKASTNVVAITRTFGEDETRRKLLNYTAQADLMILDDLGAERSTEYAIEQLYAIVDQRYRSGKPLIVTTNMTLEQLKNGPELGRRRIYERVLEMCPYRCRFTGPNRRTKMEEDEKNG